MAFMDPVRACNRHDPQRYIPFRVDGVAVGRVYPEFARQAVDCCGVFSLGDAELAYKTSGGSLEQRSREFVGLLHKLVKQGLISHLHGEQYVATPAGREQGILLVDRAAAPYFGIRAFGQHLNGFIRTPEGLMMWVGRRSADRKHFPGHLDNLAAGGLPYDISLEDNLKKECWEEASIPAELAIQAVPVGAITYCTDTRKGCKPDTLYCYDIELPEEFVPVCSDGEVDEFLLLPIRQVIDRVRDSNEFKLNCNLVIIDFLIRHGYIKPDEPDYLDLVSSLHRPLTPF